MVLNEHRKNTSGQKVQISNSYFQHLVKHVLPTKLERVVQCYVRCLVWMISGRRETWVGSLRGRWRSWYRWFCWSLWVLWVLWFQRRTTTTRKKKKKRKRKRKSSTAKTHRHHHHHRVDFPPTLANHEQACFVRQFVRSGKTPNQSLRAKRVECTDTSSFAPLFEFYFHCRCPTFYDCPVVGRFESSASDPCLPQRPRPPRCTVAARTHTGTNAPVVPHRCWYLLTKK